VKVAVINESYPSYNLACERIMVEMARQGHEPVLSARADMFADTCKKAYLSAIFTWHLPALVYDAKMLRAKGLEVEIGGPAVTAMPEYVLQESGVKPFTGLDNRWEHVKWECFKFSFTSRGCPNHCEFCLVPRLEGRKIVEYDDFNIPVGKNPYICDNNILATSWAHQKMVVARLKGVRNLDLNSGFDDRIFVHNPEKYWQLYNELDLECFRFAYDKPEQKDPIKAAADFLHTKGIDYRHIIVFCLIGGVGSTHETDRQKLQYLIDIGVSPYPMRYRPLNAITQRYNPPGWKKGDLELLFQYYGVPFVWRKCKWEDFNLEAKFKMKDTKKRAAENGDSFDWDELGS
jgi:hypothetical protein